MRNTFVISAAIIAFSVSAQAGSLSHPDAANKHHKTITQTAPVTAPVVTSAVVVKPPLTATRMQQTGSIAYGSGS
ncbi:unnamed protein product [Sphagnum tenellum]